ncbi:Kelch repeat-containing protein [Falsiroseomonas selenitidurans]|uniref:Galactose oxidase n=1 Tax=Falsiroseomonas selenitidurans TaxID=2716335 RepID=A0ABX1E6U1_9PROT|nr:kelch repeat-containing protein [Falsiroseomonas selenitidurans]NKC32503.1 galactose oxidase [Falsiroseomonas selenitidurans]
MDRRMLLGGAAALLVGSKAAGAQTMPHHGPPIPPDRLAPLRGQGPVALTPAQYAQRFVDSPAPAGAPGRWVERAALPLPRTEMAWAAEWADKLHVVGGYAEQQVNNTWHHIYDPATDSWKEAARLPRGANHVGVVAHEGRVYAFGGFSNQNRGADTLAFAYDVAADRWDRLAPMPRPRGAGALAVLGGRIHHIGGASEPERERASVGWHEVYDPQADKWEMRKALPGARDHAGVLAHNGVIHIIGGRFNTFEYNTGLHHVYLPERDTWQERAPLPTPRSGHGLVLYRGRFFAMGGESGWFEDRPGGRVLTGKVHGQMESYDPATDSWQHHAPMPTPRHGMGAVTIGDFIYVAGGGPVVGGGIKSAVHEAFTLG